VHDARSLRQTCDALWSTSQECRAESSPGVADEVLYFSSDGLYVFALP
jgi:hypothetical protein